MRTQAIDWAAARAADRARPRRPAGAARRHVRGAAAQPPGRARAGHPDRGHGGGRGGLRRPALGHDAQHLLRGPAARGSGAVLLRRGPVHAGVLGRRAVRHGHRRAARHGRGRRRAHSAGGVELPAAQLRHRRPHHRRRPRPDHPRRGPRGRVAAGVRDDRPAPRRPARLRGGGEVLPGLGDLDGGDADGRLPRVRRDRVGVPRRDRRGPVERGRGPPGRGRGHAADRRGARLQGGRRAVPHVGAGHLRRRAGRRRGLPVRGLQGRRLRRPDAGPRRRARGRSRTSGRRSSACSRRSP